MLSFFRNFLLTFAGFVALLYGCSVLFRPSLTESLPAVDSETLAEIQELRETGFEGEERIRIQQEIDYSEGPGAAWYPKGEAPILSALVEEGKLPPVEERVGSEPLVLRGVDGIGNYGGTMIQARTSKRGVGTFGTFYSGGLLVRWSPMGDPIVPHIIKGWDVNDEGREYILHFRRGMKWSDGHPFTAHDVHYWWRNEVQDDSVSTDGRNPMTHRGKDGSMEVIDDYTLAVRFEEPNGLFISKLAGPEGLEVAESPAHYLRQFHPTEGDPEIIEAAMKAMQMPTRRALYAAVKAWDNPDHPRLWPFLYRSHKGTPPFSWVRNPYFFAVDPEGNQLPYLDRALFTVKAGDLIPIAAASGEFSIQTGLLMEHYTILMSQRESGGYELYHWNYGGGSMAAIFPNMTKRKDKGDVNAEKKEALMRQKEFRQALSLAINRQTIIEVEYGGMTEAAQVGPSPASPYFNEDLYTSFVEYDPELANKLLDSIGLQERDSEGYRTFRDGSPMLFFLTYKTGSPFTAAMAQSIVEDWAAVGIRVVFKERGVNLYYIEREAMLHDFTVAGVNGEDYAVLRPRMSVPDFGSFYAHAWGYWFQRGAYYGKEQPADSLAEPPPEGHPLREAMEIYDQVIQTTDEKERIALFQKALDIAAENIWTINISTPPPILVAVKEGFRNVPRKGYSAWMFLTPSNMGFETFFWEEPEESAGAIRQIKSAIVSPLGQGPDLSGSSPSEGVETEGTSPASSSPDFGWVKVLLLTLGALGLLWLGFQFPFIGRRLLLMVPTLFIVSFLVFIIIELPPGDYSTSMIAQAEAMGEEADRQKVEELQQMFQLDESWLTRYLSWSGLRWFVTFKSEDTGFLQWDLGRSMETLEPVNDVVGDRTLLTVLISLGTVLFTWVVALPIGIFSAVKQYSIADYVFTVIGFLGMCIPNFLFALLLMYFSSTFLGINVSGLFSAEYAAQPEWTLGKFVDLLAHIWVPVVVIGTAGTASMIRVMRGNLLDELKKPYVTTARAKGVRPIKLILKYPVRLALNPFISGIGHIFPQLISGGAIVALILSLPTVGPLLLQSLLMEDMYLAGSLLMILSLLGIIGTLVSDLLLMLLDPRIRMEGGRR